MATNVDSNCKLPLRGLSIRNCRNCERQSTKAEVVPNRNLSRDNQYPPDCYKQFTKLKPSHKKYNCLQPCKREPISKTAKSNPCYIHHKRSSKETYIQDRCLKLIVVLAFQLAYSVPNQTNDQFAEAQSVPTAYRNGFLQQPPTLDTPRRQPQLINDDELAMTQPVEFVAGQEQQMLPQLHDLDWAKRVWPIGMVPPAVSSMPKPPNLAVNQHPLKSTGPGFRINLNQSSGRSFRNRLDAPAQQIESRQFISQSPVGPKSTARGLFEFLIGPIARSPARAARNSGPRPLQDQFGPANNMTVDPSPWANGQVVARNTNTAQISNIVNLSAPYETPRKRLATLSGLLNLRSINQTSHNVSRDSLEPPTEGSANPIAIASAYEQPADSGENEVSEERTVPEQGDGNQNDSPNGINWRHELHENQTWDEQQHRQNNGDPEEGTDEYGLASQQGEQQVDMAEEQQIQQPTAAIGDEGQQSQDAAAMNQSEIKSNESLIQAASFDPANESYLAAQLPSQYDAVIRVPPDGHYDDYYKPEGNRINSLSTYESIMSGTSFSPQPSSFNGNQTGGGIPLEVEEFNSNGQSRQFEITPTSQLRPEDEDTQYTNGEQSHFDKQAPITVYHQHLPGSNHQKHVPTDQSHAEQPHQRLRDLTGRQMPNSTKQTTLANDYTLQYYMNQRPLSQNAAQNDSAVEFMVSNGTYGNQEVQADQYRPIRITQNAPNRTGSGSKETNQQTTDYVDGQEVMYAQQTTRVPVLTLIDKNPPAPHNGLSEQRNNSFDNDLWRHNKTARQAGNHIEQDDNHGSIRLILANTNSSWRDPTNNEKMISYTTSEGRDFAQPGGALSAPRHTFINKDLNELPPSNETAAVPDQPINNVNHYPGARRLNSSLSTEVDDMQSHDTPRIQDGSQLQRLPDANRNASDEDDRSTGLPDDDGSNSDAANQQYRFPSGGRAMQYHQATTVKPSSRRSSSDKINSGRAKKDATIDRRRRIPKSDHGTSIRSNPSMRTAQVTEAHFDPTRDLVLHPPTQPPSVPESTISTIVELPGKVKKLRNHQADKNELMNELLTALDRVKSAIYKLQPLTAKMNAIYRKSVTSNTRDIIMDNHKGTYAKRYPPGDYDDTYDRMHPSELIERQRSSSARKGRRALSSDSNRHNNGTGGRNHASRSRGSGREDHAVSDSTTRSVYVRAPKEVAERFSRLSSNSSAANRTEISNQSNEFKLRRGPINDIGDVNDRFDKLVIDGNKLIATGIGRQDNLFRLRTGSSDASRVLYDDDESGIEDDSGDERLNKYIIEDAGVMPATRLRHPSDNDTASGANDTRTVDEDNLSPLFGYKITIYQTPVDDDGSDNKTDAGATDDVGVLPTDGLLSYRVDDVPQEKVSAADESSMDETMTTSESSLTPTTPAEFSIEPVRASGLNDAQEQLDRSESASSKKSAKKDAHSSKKRNKSEKEEGDSESNSGGSKKKSMEKGGKKASKSAENHSKGKRVEEDKKRRKEFKKIKHNKGITSKESHKMHRDKQVKAHDRGAAKEKALKERTQIEFFEREQIVDDEFEKGKKSTMKANWASGHDAKKSSSKEMSGDSMAAGSHFVKHYEPMDDAASSVMGNSEHGQTKSVETSSGKESNKFEKKSMEAKGKKFKGWREKGYKIITETEFIDRGSLHDSAYKKRDKGAAHHQKLKKHESSSEGHHGSVEERLKKLAKKEEKESTMEEKKKEMMEKGKSGENKNKDAYKFEKMSKKEMEEAKKKKSMQRAKQKKKEDDDHEQEESVGIGSIMRKPGSNVTNSTSGSMIKFDDVKNATRLDTGSRSNSSLAAKIGQISEQKRLARLINADGHESSGMGSNGHQQHPDRMQIDKSRPNDGNQKQLPSANKVGLINLPDSSDSAANMARKLQYDSIPETSARQPSSPTSVPSVNEIPSSTSAPNVGRVVYNEVKNNDSQATLIGSKDRHHSADQDRARVLAPLTVEAKRAINQPEPGRMDLNDRNNLKDPYTNEKLNLLADLIQATVARQDAQRPNTVLGSPVQERAPLNRYMPMDNQALRMPAPIDNRLDLQKIEQFGERELQQLIPPYLEQNVQIDPFDVVGNPLNRMQNFIMPTFNDNNDLKIAPNFGFGNNQPQIFPNFQTFQQEQPALMNTRTGQEPVARSWQLL